MSDVQPSTSGQTVMILGAVSLLACCVPVTGFAGPIAIYMASQHNKQAAALGVEPDPNARTGMMLGGVGTLMLLAYIVFLVLYFVMVFGLVLLGEM